MKAQANSSSRDSKDFICREEKRKTAWWGMQGGPRNWWSHRSGWGLSFKVFLAYCLGGDVFHMQVGVSWEREVSP
jgi:hypothetical protein